jgi:hypothetical protein
MAPCVAVTHAAMNKNEVVVFIVKECVFKRIEASILVIYHLAPYLSTEKLTGREEETWE